MRIFDNLVDSYMNKNYTEFEELCKSSLKMTVMNFCKLQDLLESLPDVYEAYNLSFANHPEWGEYDGEEYEESEKEREEWEDYMNNHGCADLF